MRRFLDATTSAWSPPVTAFGLTLALATQYLLSARPVLLAAAAVCVLPLTVGMTAVAVGIGARFPRFDTDNAATIATGLGALAYMLAASGAVAVAVLASITPTVVALRLVEGRPTAAWVVAVAAASLAAEVALPLVAGRLALAVGARHLERES